MNFILTLLIHFIQEEAFQFAKGNCFPKLGELSYIGQAAGENNLVHVFLVAAYNGNHASNRITKRDSKIFWIYPLL